MVSTSAMATMSLPIFVAAITTTYALELQELDGPANSAASIRLAHIGPEVPITPGNPLFDGDGNPLVAAPPAELIQQLDADGCKWAWTRQQHRVSELDAHCDGLIEPFLASSPGAALGLLNSIIDSGLINETSGVYHDEDDAITTAFANLSQFGWTRQMPAMMQPLRGYNQSELMLIESRGGVSMPYIFHAAGEWSVKVVEQASFPGAEARGEYAEPAAAMAAELWITLANHVMRKVTARGLAIKLCKAYMVPPLPTSHGVSAQPLSPLWMDVHSGPADGLE
jgi:hypothetical protein